MHDINVSKRAIGLAAVTLLTVLGSVGLEAHGVSGKDAVFLQGLNGQAIGPLMYLGAKHMVTGYDHLLFLVGVIFFLYRLKDVLLYVSLFTLGHSLTLLGGVLGGIHANATKTADISIVGAGDVTLAGGAKCTVSKVGAGDVTDAGVARGVVEDHQRRVLARDRAEQVGLTREIDELERLGPALQQRAQGRVEALAIGLEDHDRELPVGTRDIGLERGICLE